MPAKAEAFGAPRRASEDFDERLTGDHDPGKEERSWYSSPSYVQESEPFSSDDAGARTTDPLLPPAGSDNAEPVASPSWSASLFLVPAPGLRSDNLSPAAMHTRNFSTLAQKDGAPLTASPDAERVASGSLPSLLSAPGEDRATGEAGEGVQTAETVGATRRDAWESPGENEAVAVPRLTRSGGKDSPTEGLDGTAPPSGVESVCAAGALPLRSEQTAREETKAPESESPQTYVAASRKGLTKRRGARRRSISRHWSGEARGTTAGRAARGGAGSPPYVAGRAGKASQDVGTIPLNDLLRLFALAGPGGLQPQESGAPVAETPQETFASGQPGETWGDLASFSTFLESLLNTQAPLPPSVDVCSALSPVAGNPGATLGQGDCALRRGHAEGAFSGEKDQWNQTKRFRDSAGQADSERGLVPPRAPDAGHQPPLGADARPRKGRDADLDAVYKTKMCPFLKTGWADVLGPLPARSLTRAPHSALLRSQVRPSPNAALTNTAPDAVAALVTRLPLMCGNYRHRPKLSCAADGACVPRRPVSPQKKQCSGQRMLGSASTLVCSRGDRYKVAPNVRKMEASREAFVRGGEHLRTAKTSSLAPKDTTFWTADAGECLDARVARPCADLAAEEEVFRHLDDFFSSLSSHCGGSTPLPTEDENSAPSGLPLRQVHGASSSSGTLSVSVASSSVSRTLTPSGASLDSTPPGSASFGLFPTLEALACPVADAHHFSEGEDGRPSLSALGVFPSHLRASSDPTADYGYPCLPRTSPLGHEAPDSAAPASVCPSPPVAVAPGSCAAAPSPSGCSADLLKKMGSGCASAGAGKSGAGYSGAREGQSHRAPSSGSADPGAKRGDRPAATASQGVHQRGLARASTASSVASEVTLPVPVTASKTRRGKRGGRRKRGGRDADARRAHSGRDRFNAGRDVALGGSPIAETNWVQLMEALASRAVLPASLASALVALSATGGDSAGAPETPAGGTGYRGGRREVSESEERLNAYEVDRWGQPAPLWLRPQPGLGGLSAQAHEAEGLTSTLQAALGSSLRPTDEGHLGGRGGNRIREELRGQSQKLENAVASVSGWSPLGGGVGATETAWPDVSAFAPAQSSGKGAPSFPEDPAAGSALSREGTTELDAYASDEKTCARLLLLQCLQELVSRLPALNNDEIRCLTTLLRLPKNREAFCK
ncbi:conserved hypothetical protein [Neospora caninum Liverpool]|uniref:Uncharacterized protein n=1 Tax=Neospora caninum (strain Liverpool) TaxID=572307 RepID=F0VP27_NEOCL|nr:conserved hypothetical protein [Neospora caninum Liverpool]CBZ55473.1 conserved hypothetical protein [Neospora caninum Liverpool]|eukprot:XP_003885501.1 conserved hypothetical protein [Neospora caninum Liverpool]